MYYLRHCWRTEDKVRAENAQTAEELIADLMKAGKSREAAESLIDAFWDAANLEGWQERDAD